MEPNEIFALIYLIGAIITFVFVISFFAMESATEGDILIILASFILAPILAAIWLPIVIILVLVFVLTRWGKLLNHLFKKGE